MKLQIAICFIAFAVAALLPAGANAQFSEEGRALIASGVTGEQFDEALGNFLQDGSQGETMAKLAINGHPVAIRTVAHQCLYSDVCPVSRKEAHDMLAAHARTDGISASDLGVIYHWGKYGTADDVMAARWLGHAHALGEANARLFLGNLAPDAVAQADLSHLLAAGASAQQAQNSGPTRLSWPGRAGFPVFADTTMSDEADAAMSCHLVLGAKFDREAARLGIQGNVREVQILELEILNQSAESSLSWAKNPRTNGGISGAAFDRAAGAHVAQMDRAPASGPSADFCERNLTQFQTELVLDN